MFFQLVRFVQRLWPNSPIKVLAKPDDACPYQQELPPGWQPPPSREQIQKLLRDERLNSSSELSQ